MFLCPQNVGFSVRAKCILESQINTLHGTHFPWQVPPEISRNVFNWSLHVPRNQVSKEHVLKQKMLIRDRVRSQCNCMRCMFYCVLMCNVALQWRHNGLDGVSNHQPHHCLFSRLFGRRSKKTSKLRVTGICAGNSPGTGNSPHKWPVTRKMFPFDDVIMA